MQHLFRVTRDASAFEVLIRAVRRAGERAGWLELAPASSCPDELETAAGFGVLRAVAVGGGRSVAVKPLRGEPVLKDLLREHFRGCLLVLVRGGAAPAPEPALEPQGEDWRVEIEGETRRTLKTEELIAALRRPHPWTKPTRAVVLTAAGPDARTGTAPNRRKKRK